MTVSPSFDEPYDKDRTYSITITDSAIAAVSASTLTLTAGETEASAEVTGVSTGTTSFGINQLSNFLALTIPAIVNEARLSAGSHRLISQQLGVAFYTEPSLSGNIRVAARQPLGIARGTVITSTSPAIIQRGAAHIIVVQGAEPDVATALPH